MLSEKYGLVGMEEPLVSIVIPAYNAEKYLGDCLDSVAAQTFSRYEAIVVDDESTDGTARIIKERAACDGRIRYVGMDKNRGLSAARNAGTASSGAPYITYLDADDCLNPQFLETMLNAIVECGVDICRCGIRRGADFMPVTYQKFNVRILSYHEAMEAALYQKMILSSAWGMVIKKEIVEEAGGFREGVWYEDLDSFYRFYEGQDKIAYIPQQLYFYRKNESSFLGNWSRGRLDVLDVTDRIVEYIGKTHPELLKAACDRRFSAHYNMLLLMLRHKVAETEAMERCLRVVREGRRGALADRRVRPKNKIGALVSWLGMPTLRLLSKL